jgi:hypothetical protein
MQSFCLDKKCRHVVVSSEETLSQSEEEVLMGERGCWESLMGSDVMRGSRDDQDLIVASLEVDSCWANLKLANSCARDG